MLQWRHDRHDGHVRLQWSSSRRAVPGRHLGAMSCTPRRTVML